MANTKARHEEILNAATEVLKSAGGVETIEALPKRERIPKLREMAMFVAKKTNCTADPARRNVAKAMHRARFGLMQDRWGGPDRNQGRTPLPADQKRQRVSTRLAPGSKELAQAIAEIWELPSWGHAVDKVLVRMVENDRELKVKLAEMGIILKAQK